MTANELGLLLHEYDVYDTMQFVIGAQRAIFTALFCKDVLQGLHNGVQKSTDEWMAELIERKNSVNKNEWTRVGGWPDNSINIAGVEISSFFVQNFLISSFFQNSRNAFDILAQAANAGCLATRAKKIESVDFPRMKGVFQQESYKGSFPLMNEWFEAISKAKEFTYIDAYCNRTKHTCSLPTKFTIPMFNTDNKATVPAFYREKDCTQFEKQEVFEHIPALYEFIAKAYHDFIEALKQEIPNRVYTKNRKSTVKVYQQKYLQYAEKGFSMAFIDETDDFIKMPDMIQVLFTHKLKHPDGKEEIEAGNCFFDTIYVKAKEARDINGLVGKYVAVNPIGKDDLLRFRTYKKVIPERDSLPLIFEAMEDKKQRGKFYTGNRYFLVETVSDDQELLNLANISL